MSIEDELFSIVGVRERLGQMWGLGRPLTRIELTRALRLSEKADYISRVESRSGGIIDGGALQVALELMLDGAKPRNMDDLITPGYPRGQVK